jgi:anti-sigma B factor antagonist
MQQLTMERSSPGPVELLEVTGEIDIASASRLISGLNEAVGDCDKPVVVDLTAVDFMDSTGLALLLNAHRRLARRDMGFAVVCSDGPVHRVFEITDMLETLRVRPDRESAVSAAVGQPA